MNTELAKEVAWVEIDFNRLRNNIQTIRNTIGNKSKMMGIVKANAYGHGLKEISSFLIENDVDILGVVSVSEGLSIRASGINAPIVLLGVIAPEQAASVVQARLIPTVTSVAVVEALNEIGKRKKQKISVHIRIDLGLGSIGVLPSESVAFIEKVSEFEWIEIEGLYTHLASSYDENQVEIDHDLSIFNDILQALFEREIVIPVIHVASSAAILTLPYTFYDMVRPGISMYGLPSLMNTHNEQLKPVMQLKAKIVALKNIPRGTLMGGYGARYYLEKDTLIATVPLGYGDGLFLYFLMNGEVLVHGKRAKMIGKSFMDYFMIDVTGFNDVKIGDEVVIFGEQLQEEITAAEVAERANMGRMNCDCVTLLSNRVPRIYTNIESNRPSIVVAEGL